MRAYLPWVEGALDGHLKRGDADPEAARVELRPRIVRAFALTPDELAEAS